MAQETCEELQNLESEDPELVAQLYHKRSLKVKDPARSTGKDTFAVNELPLKALKSVITPYILKKDSEACQNIIDKIHADEISAEYREQLKAKSRQQTRTRFFTQHEKNIERERNGGVFKSYSKLVSSSPQDKIASLQTTLLNDQGMQE